MSFFDNFFGSAPTEIPDFWHKIESEEDLEQELAKMAESYKMEVDKLKSTLRPSDMDYIKDTVVARKTVEFIKGNANLQ